MDALGNFIIGFPSPIGIVASALFPLIAIGAGAGSVLAFRGQRRSLAILLVAASLIALLGALAFLSVAGRS